MFSRILQSSGLNVYCHPDVLSAALNFDGGGAHLSPLSSSLSHQATLRITPLGSFRVRKWWVERRREEQSTLWGKPNAVVVSLMVTESLRFNKWSEEMGMFEG